MPASLHQLYQCQGCKTAARRSHSFDPAPLCCGQAMKWLRTFTENDPPPAKFGQAPAIDFRNTSPIEVPIGAGGMRFESVAELRRFERETEHMAADGIGQPYVIRGYSQDRSNMAVHTLGDAEKLQQAPDLSRVGRDGQPRVRVTSHELRAHGDAAYDAATMGPGASEALASALPMDPGE